MSSTPPPTPGLEGHLAESQAARLASLEEFLRIPSISGIHEYADDVRAAAGWLADAMRSAGIENVSIEETGGHPVVYGDWLHADGGPTVLIYGHYDVQPVDPLDEWASPPFAPVIRDGRILGRGAADDKGQVHAHVMAAGAVLATRGSLPINVRYLFEGEEESASIHLHDWLVAHRDRVPADVAIISDSGFFDDNLPAITVGLRGLMYAQIDVTGSPGDLHSGSYGGAVQNPINALAQIITALKGPDGRIRIPGFYDGIKPPSTRDRELMEALPEVSEEYKSRFGVKQFIKGLTGGTDLKIEEVFSPTCTICGLTSGYQGPGSKTVLPARASAKVDFRLVPDQHPADILKKLRAHLDAEGFSDVHITDLGGDPPARTDPDEPFIQLVAKTAEEVFGMPMQLVPLIGGSGPSYPFVHDLKLPVATSGLGYPDTRAHAPNENIRVDLYLKHARHMARLIKEFSA